MFKRKAKEKKIKTPRFQTFRDAYNVTKVVKPWIPFALLGIFIATLLIGIAIGISLGHPLYFAFIFLPLSFLTTLLFFTRQAGTAAYSSIEGQMGAGASVLMAIRKGWTTTPAVAVARNQDMVHRSVGRAGIVLTGEGSQGVNQMLTEERKKTERFAPGVPITLVVVGDEKGQVALRKLQKHLQKMPKKLTAHQMREVRARLKAVGGLSMPIPKGPMPTRAPKMR
jgi:F0F1-type ATP synthase assembly protein I